MIQKIPKDFHIWLFWLTTTLIPMILASDQRWRYQYSDKTGITNIIIILFIISLVINVTNTIRIAIEFSQINNSKGLFKEHITTLERAAQGKLSISQDFSLTIIENRLLRQESWVQLFANLSITLGMIGTVVGLTLSMEGLSEAMGSMTNVGSETGGNFNDPTIGLKQALSGMSSAFITTLAGAVLGGFFLKLLSHSTINLIEDLIDQIRYKAELEIIPKLQQQIWEKDVRNLSDAYQNMKTFIQSSSQIDQSLRKYNEKMSEASEKLLSISSKLNREIFQLQISSQVQKQENLEKLLNQIVIVLNVIQKLTYILIGCIFIFIVIFVLSLIN
ncbi:MotA/TolQ/ExbB proton channel family protein [Planktothrix sp. FACHB-1365]|uniref:MotA/TolQ/ExbB proton channel family protein n=1 Tax=Planktothrix sp. FACHB-1365 TaxID=2692855 RepID=UPI0016837D3E|nr:MotA/TolQ/ExbB proton channel family protein [Planktothrix sp. FACHB-1365]MBD2484950.1 MotA/TolQ/ExbB proton channel family protein [Planktothrix sp. FACHB-1365]